MDCEKLHITFTFSLLPRKTKTCLMWHVFATLLSEFFVTEPLTRLLCWSVSSALQNFATHWQSLCKRAEGISPPLIYLSCKFWHVLKCNRIIWKPDSYFLDKHSNHKSYRTKWRALSQSNFLLLKTMAKEMNWHHFIQTSNSGLSVRHYWECLLGYRGLIRTPSSWTLSWFTCIRKTLVCSASPSQQ